MRLRISKSFVKQQATCQKTILSRSKGGQIGCNMFLPNKQRLSTSEDDDGGNQEVLSEMFACQVSVPPRSSRSCSSGALGRTAHSRQPAATHTDPNWQANCSTLRDRNMLMFNNELMADVYFRVGVAPNTVRIPGHKYILATGSSVFYAMFYGGLAQTSLEDIDIPDIEPNAFLNLLKFLYYDKIEREADTVLATLYAAKKYIVPSLARELVQFLETSLCAKNACVLLSQSRLFEEHDLMRRCWKVIDAQTEVALQSEGFTEIDRPTLEMILERETLNVKEMSIFEAALRWAEAECRRRDLDPVPKNLRGMLGDALYLIRIPTMKLEEYADGAAQSGVLTLQETTDVFLHYTAHTKRPVRFATTPRRGLTAQCCHRFQSCAYRSNQWRYRGRCDSIQFSVDRRVFIAGFGLYGSSNGGAEYVAKIELKRGGLVQGQTQCRFTSDGSSQTFPVYFDHPLQMEPEVFYTASIVLDGGELSYFGQDGMTEVTSAGVNFQFQCSSDSTNGTGVQGGQIPELIFYS